MRRVAPALALFALGCAGSPPASQPSAHHGGHGAHHGGHGDHASHGHHDHSDPAALRTLMRALQVDLLAVRAGLEAGDLPTAAKHADAVAKACEGSGPPPADTSKYGTRFAEFDQALHGNAAELAKAAAAGSAADARSSYGQVVEACAGCHGQAPLAMEVDISALQAPLKP